MPAITSRIASVELVRSTVFGDVTVNRLSASDTLIQGLTRVTDNQNTLRDYDGSAIEVKTEASTLPVNKRPRLAVRIIRANDEPPPLKRPASDRMIIGPVRGGQRDHCPLRAAA